MKKRLIILIVLIFKISIFVFSLENPNIDGALGGNFNEVLKEGNYLFMNKPKNGPKELQSFSGILHVESTNNRWIYQRLISLNDISIKYERVIDNKEIPIFYEWYQNKILFIDKNISGKIIVNFGDSIFGNVTGGTSISNFISSLSGATVYNVGFGGCKMSSDESNFDSFSMYRLVDAVISKNFIQQEEVIKKNEEIPRYFREHLELLKNIDFTKVDFVTISYGTNDYTAGKEIDNFQDKEDKNTYSGALRYALRRLFETYPHIKILVLTPTYRFWSTKEGEFIEDSDTRAYNSKKETILSFVAATTNVAMEFKTPYLDQYFELGINKYNRLEYFSKSDGTHPNYKGRLKMSEKIVEALKNKF
ncbi:MAG: SGNH/GDSL hydrolase family protein [Fusobacterium ulcerans]|uniref:SGNH/GDSL hydrolase family protein n=1 Tax=Fusobacterium ulcerans TaxID=861 RepID=UPI003A841A8C